MRNFQRPETIPIWAEVKDWAGEYATPTSVKLTVIHKEGTVPVVDNQSMDLADELVEGIYVYYWTSLADSVLGWYVVTATITDGAGEGTIVTIELGGFNLQ